jgi:hypothetical protein
MDAVDIEVVSVNQSGTATPLGFWTFESEEVALAAADEASGTFHAGVAISIDMKKAVVTVQDSPVLRQKQPTFTTVAQFGRNHVHVVGPGNSVQEVTAQNGDLTVQVSCGGTYTVLPFAELAQFDQDGKTSVLTAEKFNGKKLLVAYYGEGSRFLGMAPIVTVDSSNLISIPDREDAKTIKVDMENKFLENYECFNVIAKVEGNRHDSCYVFTAHYDHLGKLGKKTFYPGAHDNASGTAAIITFAAHYAKNKPEFDMYFIAFSGEDANLRGSDWYVEHPIVPLSQIKFLFNLDMIADNNPKQYCEFNDVAMEGYALFEKINAEKGYFEALDRHELDENSDHWPFAKKNVPVVFFMNEHGDAYKYYHTVHDTYQNHISTNYEPSFKIIEDFIKRY